MSGWDALVAYEMRATDPVNAHHEWWVRSGGHGTGRWSQKAFLAGVAWVLERQGEWESLTEADAIHELRKGADSIYYPLFADNPKILADCPRDGRTAVGAGGLCDHCLFDFAKD